tara:strand:- start:197 stop:379 length:183 start_codon:yes stop_codon:yes gene_type:complete
MEKMTLTEDELAMLMQALESTSFVNGLSVKPNPEQVRLQRKLHRWADHPDLEFTTTEKGK